MAWLRHGVAVLGALEDQLTLSSRIARSGRGGKDVVVHAVR